MSEKEIASTLREKGYYVAGGDIFSSLQNPVYLGRIEKDARINPAWCPNPSENMMKELARLRRTSKKCNLPIIDSPYYRMDCVEKIKLRMLNAEEPIRKELSQMILDLS